MIEILAFSLVSLVAGLIIGGLVGFNYSAKLVTMQLNAVMRGEENENEETKRFKDLMVKALNHESWWLD